MTLTRSWEVTAFAGQSNSPNFHSTLPFHLGSSSSGSGKKEKGKVLSDVQPAGTAVRRAAAALCPGRPPLWPPSTGQGLLLKKNVVFGYFRGGAFHSATFQLARRTPVGNTRGKAHGVLSGCRPRHAPIGSDRDLDSRTHGDDAIWCAALPNHLPGYRRRHEG